MINKIKKALTLNGQRQYDYILKMIQDAREEGVEMARKEVQEEFLERLEYINIGEGYTKEYYRTFLIRLIKELRHSLEEKGK